MIRLKVLGFLLGRKEVLTFGCFVAAVALAWLQMQR